jgi:hypothetical protein
MATSLRGVSPEGEAQQEPTKSKKQSYLHRKKEIILYILICGE